jgi:hypothetical protein
MKDQHEVKEEKVVEVCSPKKCSTPEKKTNDVLKPAATNEDGNPKALAKTTPLALGDTSISAADVTIMQLGILNISRDANPVGPTDSAASFLSNQSVTQEETDGESTCVPESLITQQEYTAVHTPVASHRVNKTGQTPQSLLTQDTTTRAVANARVDMGEDSFCSNTPQESVTTPLPFSGLSREVLIEGQQDVSPLTLASPIAANHELKTAGVATPKTDEETPKYRKI